MTPVASEVALARELDRQMRSVCRRLRDDVKRIGRIGQRMRENNCFAVLGYSEYEYCELVGCPPATWYRHVQIAAGYVKLDDKTYYSMDSGKAFLMLELPESERIKPMWVRRAADRKVTQKSLAGEIQLALECGDVRKDATSKEERGWLKIRMYVEDIKHIHEVLDAYCAEHGFGDDRGRAMAMLFADIVIEGLERQADQTDDGVQ